MIRAGISPLIAVLLLGFFAQIAGGTLILLPGDANMDGVVDGRDATVLATNWLSREASWESGDFNGDGIVNGIDITLLSANWQVSYEVNQDSVVSHHPEPTSFVVWGLIVVCLSSVYRRRCRS